MMWCAGQAPALHRPAILLLVRRHSEVDDDPGSHHALFRLRTLCGSDADDDEVRLCFRRLFSLLGRLLSVGQKGTAQGPRSAR